MPCPTTGGAAGVREPSEGCSGDGGRRGGGAAGAARTVCGQPASFEEERREQRGGLRPAEAAREGIRLVGEVAAQRAVAARDDAQPRRVNAHARRRRAQVGTDLLCARLRLGRGEGARVGEHVEARQRLGKHGRQRVDGPIGEHRDRVHLQGCVCCQG